jgi:hypothetical protein
MSGASATKPPVFDLGDPLFVDHAAIAATRPAEFRSIPHLGDKNGQAFEFIGGVFTMNISVPVVSQQQWDENQKEIAEAMRQREVHTCFITGGAFSIDFGIEYASFFVEKSEPWVRFPLHGDYGRFCKANSYCIGCEYVFVLAYILFFRIGECIRWINSPVWQPPVLEAPVLHQICKDIYEHCTSKKDPENVASHSLFVHAYRTITKAKTHPAGEQDSKIKDVFLTPKPCPSQNGCALGRVNPPRDPVAESLAGFFDNR